MVVVVVVVGVEVTAGDVKADAVAVCSCDCSVSTWNGVMMIVTVLCLTETLMSRSALSSKLTVTWI